MKNSNLYNKWQELDAHERQELAAAVKAHGGKYVFIDCESDDANEKWFESDHDGAPIVLASGKHWDTYTDCYVSRVEVDEDGYLYIFGFDSEYGDPTDEEELTFVGLSHISFITGIIPETEEVQDVSQPLRREVHIVISDEVYEFESNVRAKPFAKKEDAIAEFQNQVNEAKEYAERDEWEINEDGPENFESQEPGNYSSNHSLIWIQTDTI